MGLLRKIASWRIGFALVFMCLTTVVFFRDALTPELAITGEIVTSSNRAFTFRPSTINPTADPKTKEEAKKVVTVVNTSSPLTMEDIKSKLTEIARDKQEKLGITNQDPSIDDNTLQWIAGTDNPEMILKRLEESPLEEWGNLLINLQMHPMEEKQESLKVRHSEGACDFGENCAA